MGTLVVESENGSSRENSNVFSGKVHWIGQSLCGFCHPQIEHISEVRQSGTDTPQPSRIPSHPGGIPENYQRGSDRGMEECHCQGGHSEHIDNPRSTLLVCS